MKQTKKRNKITIPALRYICRLVWREKPAYFFYYLLQLFAQVTITMTTMIVPKYIIDDLAQVVKGRPFFEVKYHMVIMVGILIGTVFVCNSLVNLTNALLCSVGEWFNRYLEQQIAEHAMNMDFEHTEDPKALDQLNKAKDGASWYSGGVKGILDAFFSIASNVTILIGVTMVVFLGCPWLVLIQGIGMIIVTIYNAKNNELEVQSYLKLSSLNRRFGYFFFETSQFKYGKDIRLYDSTNMMCDKADIENNKILQIWKNRMYRAMKNSWVMDCTNSLRDGMSYFYIGYLALTKVITIGELSMYVSAASNFFWSVFRIVEGIQHIVKRCNYINQYTAFMQYPEAMPKGNKQVPDTEHIIEFKDVSFRYPRTEKYILRHLNLTIRSGEHLSIVGLNGAGKTTFIKLLCRLYDVSEGEILVDGCNIKEYSQEEYRKLFAVVFQDFELFAFTLKENVALQDSDTCDCNIVNHTLELSGVYEDAIKLENGIDTIIYKSFDQKGTDLSGGQRQKVAISRALYKNAPIVILDEPTAALDPVAEYEIYRKFNELVGGKTAIYISHRLSSCKFCDHIAVFAEDSIKEYGTHDELVQKNDGIYAEMFHAQAQYYVND